MFMLIRFMATLTGNLFGSNDDCQSFEEKERRKVIEAN